MASTYSPLLRLELIGTGEQAGTWGDTTNTNLGTLLEQAIAGTATFSVNSSDVTLTDLDGASDQARCAILNVTGTPGVSRNIIAPATSKLYLINNGSDDVVVIKTASSTGYTVLSDTSLWVFFDGSDFVPASVASNSTGSISVTGDLEFIGSGQRITGDFSSSTNSERVIFQTSVSNGQTVIRAMPNGSGDAAAVQAANSSDPDNTEIFNLECDVDSCNIHATGRGTFTSFPIVFIVGGSERARITTDGEWMIAGTTDQGAYNLQVNGTGVWGAGAYVNGSDARIKENVEELGSCLDAVKAMRPVTYQYKRSYSKDQSVQPGFIAQELQTAFAGKNFLNGVVQEGPKHLNVAYQNIIPVLTKAIQEQQEQIEQLKAEVAALKGA